MTEDKEVKVPIRVEATEEKIENLKHGAIGDGGKYL